MTEKLTTFASIPALPILKFGTYRNGTTSINQKTFDDMIANFSRFARIFAAKLKLGHNPGYNKDNPSGFPSVGVPVKLFQKGEILFAKIKDVPDIVAKMINKGLFSGVSIEAYFDTKKYGSIMSGIALLGAERPQIENLGDFEVFLSNSETRVKYEDLPLTNDQAAINRAHELLNTTAPIFIDFNNITEVNTVDEETKKKLAAGQFTQEQLKSLIAAEKSELASKHTQEIEGVKTELASKLTEKEAEIAKLNLQIKTAADTAAQAKIESHFEANKGKVGYLPVNKEGAITLMSNIYASMGTEGLDNYIKVQETALKDVKPLVTFGSITASKGADDHMEPGTDNLDVEVTKFNNRTSEIMEKQGLPMARAIEVNIAQNPGYLDSKEDERLTQQVLKDIRAFTN